ncbi:hypothetical protein ABZU76_17825 [Amycolatopsis sp. NPDC005232]|uniref:hypothetical protein n=1 Tax=Amycolatopsis sp. NPDC005232 TaxID=3157027 RepID=UPI0033A5B4EA
MDIDDPEVADELSELVADAMAERSLVGCGWPPVELGQFGFGVFLPDLVLLQLVFRFPIPRGS